MRLVDVDELKKQMCNECFGGNCGYRCYEWTLMNNAPTVDPVKHGHWILSEDRYFKTCSECGAEVDVSMGLGIFVDDIRVDEMNYCPNCGAYMGVVKHETD